MLYEDKLSTKQRNALDDKEFGIPELRAYPLNDVSHVEQAVRMFNYVEPEYEKELADNLNKAIKKFGLHINVGDNNRFKKYVKESTMNKRSSNMNSILEGLSTINEGKTEDFLKTLKEILSITSKAISEIEDTKRDQARDLRTQRIYDAAIKELKGILNVK